MRRRALQLSLKRCLGCLRRKTLELAGAGPTCAVVMAFPLRSRRENARIFSSPLPDRPWVGTPCATDNFLFCLRREAGRKKPCLLIFQSTALACWWPGVESERRLQYFPIAVRL